MWTRDGGLLFVRASAVGRGSRHDHCMSSKVKQTRISRLHGLSNHGSAEFPPRPGNGRGPIDPPRRRHLALIVIIIPTIPGYGLLRRCLAAWWHCGDGPQSPILRYFPVITIITSIISTVKCRHRTRPCPPCQLAVDR